MAGGIGTRGTALDTDCCNGVELHGSPGGAAGGGSAERAGHAGWDMSMCASTADLVRAGPQGQTPTGDATRCAGNTVGAAPEGPHGAGH